MEESGLPIDAGTGEDTGMGDSSFDDPKGDKWWEDSAEDE